MAFTTQIFLYVFFPLCLMTYYLVMILQKKGTIGVFLKKIRATDIVLIGIGCVFYSWVCFDDAFRLLIYVLAIYVLGNIIHKGKTKNMQKMALFVAVGVVVFVLIHFKYLNMIIDIWNFFFKDSVRGKNILAPFGDFVY